MRALIVDDERLARNELRCLLGRHPEIEIVGEAANAPQARQALEDLEPDLLFLDVQMPGETGFDLLASLDCVPLVVFTTAYDEYALRAFEVNALDYLVKPIESGRLAATVRRVLAQASALAATAPQGLAARRRSGLESTTQRLERLIGEELRRGNPTLEHLAARLRMSPRTLHRRLGEEGTGFRRVLARLRRELAARHLREARLALGEIAFLLGSLKQARSTAPSSAEPAGRRWRTGALRPRRRHPRHGAPRASARPRNACTSASRVRPVRAAFDCLFDSLPPIHNVKVAVV
jgi:DNA-binding NarL/FixJ family response regulator